MTVRRLVQLSLVAVACTLAALLVLQGGPAELLLGTLIYGSALWLIWRFVDRRLAP